MRIETLFDYSDNCQSLLGETLRKYPDELHRSFETTSPYKSIAQLFAHCIGAEERWIDLRIHGKPIPVSYELRQSPSIDGLISDAKLMRDSTRLCLSSLTDDDLQRLVSFRIGEKEIAVTVEQALFQIVNHENYHRGQIVAALQRQGIDPPNFDFVLLHA